jgi:peptidoglycan/LPS O-acetylase OafA/YrhL
MDKNQRFEYLDSIRGLSAMSVLFTHGLPDRLFFHGYFFGVLEFFLLSSFLLTFHMVKRFEKTQSAGQSILNVILNYFVMRFFRIYLPFVVFCLLATSTDYELFINNKDPISFRSFVLLEYSNFSNSSYLWTIPVEIAYYFFIPFFSFMFYKFKFNYKQSILIHLMVLFCQAYLYKIDFEKNYYDKYIFFVQLPVFITGSSLANLYTSLTDSNLMEKINNNRLMTNSLSMICFVCFLIGSRFYVWFDRLTYHFCVFWSTHLLMMLVSAPNNYVTSFLEKFKLLKIIGKYSFGFYLFHGLSIGLYRKEKNFLKEIDLLDYFLIRVIILYTQALFFGYLFFVLIENNCIKMANIINAWIFRFLNTESNQNIIR